MGYFAIGPEKFYQPDICYLCKKKLSGKLSVDHIIPDRLFRKADPSRPKLRVHHDCNQGKSLDDQWFVKLIQLRCGFNKDAEQELHSFMDEAVNQNPDAHLIGKRPTKFVLAKKIFDRAIWGMDVISDGREMKMLELPKEDFPRFKSYIETMCLGLFLCRVEDANPRDPDVLLRQYAYLDLHGGRNKFIESIKNFIKISGPTLFGQRWGSGNLIYFGSRVAETANKGYIFMEFYREFGILASFE